MGKTSWQEVVQLEPSNYTVRTRRRQQEVGKVGFLGADVSGGMSLSNFADLLPT